MKLTLDGQQLDLAELKNVETFAELIRNLENRLAPERVIVSMTLDEVPLDPEAEKAKADARIENLEKLEIRTQRVVELASNTLNTLIDYLPGLIEAVDECVELFQGGDESQAHRRLGALIDGLQMVSQAWRGIVAFIDIEDGKPGEMMPDMQAFFSILQAILQAQINGDTVQICDNLEFELVPVLESWLEHATTLRERLTRKV